LGFAQHFPAQFAQKAAPIAYMLAGLGQRSLIMQKIALLWGTTIIVAMHCHCFGPLGKAGAILFIARLASTRFKKIIAHLSESATLDLGLAWLGPAAAAAQKAASRA